MDAWGSDAMPSLPEPGSKEVLVDFEGFGFTAGGIAYRITEEDWEAMIAPMFAPERSGIEGTGAPYG